MWVQYHNTCGGQRTTYRTLGVELKLPHWQGKYLYWTILSPPLPLPHIPIFEINYHCVAQTGLELMTSLPEASLVVLGFQGCPATHYIQLSAFFFLFFFNVLSISHKMPLAILAPKYFWGFLIPPFHQI